MFNRGATRAFLRGGRNELRVVGSPSESKRKVGGCKGTLIRKFVKFALKIVVYIESLFKFYLNELGFSISLETN